MLLKQCYFDDNYHSFNDQLCFWELLVSQGNREKGYNFHTVLRIKAQIEGDGD